MATDKLLEAFDSIRSGVYIVTSAYRRKPAGCTVVWLSRVSFSPPLLAVHLAPDGHTFDTIREGKRFCVNVLGESSLQLARRFGFASGHHENKFEGVGFSKSDNGSPILDVAVSYIDCQLESITQVGDHFMLIGKIIAAERVSEEEPMVYDPNTIYLGTMQRIETLEKQATARRWLARNLRMFPCPGLHAETDSVDFRTRQTAPCRAERIGCTALERCLCCPTARRRTLPRFLVLPGH